MQIFPVKENYIGQALNGILSYRYTNTLLLYYRLAAVPLASRVFLFKGLE